MEKRRDPRFRARFESLVSSGSAEGAGVLVDISYSGARLEETTLKPELGTKVRLYVFIRPMSPFEIVGEVVRVEESSFAMAYQVKDPEVQRLVDDVAALVSIR